MLGRIRIVVFGGKQNLLFQTGVLFAELLNQRSSRGNGFVLYDECQYFDLVMW